MNCHQVRDHLTLYQYGGLSPGENGAMEHHLAQCPTCRREHERLKEFGNLLDQVAVPVVDVNVPAIYFRVNQRQERRVKFWRRAAIGAGFVAAAGVLLAFVLKVEMKVEEHQAIFRWGNPPVLKAAVIEAIPTPKSLEPDSTIPGLRRQVAELSELVQGLTVEAEIHDRKSEERFAILQTRFDGILRFAIQKLATTEKDVAALVSTQSSQLSKGVSR